MPLYEYQCQQCGQTVEVIQKFSDDPLTECGQCGGTLERLLSAPAIQFKGSGWYITDYARGKNGDSKPKDGSKPEAAADSKSESDDKSAKDAKPAKESSETSKSESKADNSPPSK